MRKVVPHFWVAVGGVLLTFVGLIGPWMRVIGLVSASVTGLDTDDGKIIGLALLGAALFLAVAYFQNRSAALWVAALSGLAVTGGAGYDLYDISSGVDEVNSEFATASVGWGLYATVLGGLVISVGTLLTITESRKRPKAATQPPMQTVLPPAQR
jgi:hypothetical protein